MKTKADIVANWLPRYTGTPLKDFGRHILLVNFNNYVEMFAKWHKMAGRIPKHIPSCRRRAAKAERTAENPCLSGNFHRHNFNRIFKNTR
jgi:hypothetical protein